MADTFELKTNSYNGRYMRLYCTQTKDIANNRSKIDWTLYVEGNSGTCYTTGPTSIYIGESRVYYKARTSWESGAFPAKAGSTSGTIYISHGNDGTKSINCSITTAIYTSTASTVNKTWVLNNIPRAATITSAPNFTDEENPTVYYSNPAGSVVSSLQICITIDGTTETGIGYKEIPNKTDTSYTFSLTESERNTLRNSTPNSNNLNVGFYLKTVIYGNSYYSKVWRVFNIVNANPTINQTIIDSNSETVSLTGNKNKLIRYHSNAAITIGASAVKGSTLKDVSVSNGNKTITSNGTFYGVESGDFIFTAVDSRGNRTTKNVSSSLVNYVKLTCNIDNSTPDTDGNFTFKLSGNCFNGSFGSSINALFAEYRYRSKDGSYCDWTQMTVVKSGNTYTATDNITGLDYRATYIFQARVSDKLEAITTNEKVIKSEPVFDWSSSDFKFNVPVYTSSGRVLSEKEILDVVYPINSVYISYSNVSPAKRFGGTWIRVRTDEDLGTFWRRTA